MNTSSADDRTEPAGPPEPHRRSRRTGRRPGDSGTRDDILRAARRVFARHGYSGARMRDIADEAKVNSALIHHFFESKEGVFLAAIRDVYSVADVIEQIVLDGPFEEMGARLLRGYLDLWERPATQEPMLAIVRSAVSNDEAAHLMAGFLREKVVLPVITTVDVTEPGLRATLIGTQFVGLAMVRYVIKVEPLVSLDRDRVIELCSPTVQRYLTGDLEELPAPVRAPARPAPSGGAPLGLHEGLFLAPPF